MRYYSVAITNPATGAAVLPDSLGGMAITSLLPDGTTNPAALQVQFEIKIANLEDFDSNSIFRIYGLGLKDIGAAFNLNGMNIVIRAGMAKGLPLANPAQQGIVLKGNIYQAFGNWVGTDQWVDMIFAPYQITTTPPSNFPFAWKAGTTLASAIAQTLKTAMPDFNQKINISPNLIVNHDESGFYQNAQQFATWINGRSKDIIGGTYGGVTITTNGSTITAFDGTVMPPQIKQIAFQDMIGQPTWIGFEAISLKFTLRGDLNVGDVIHLPLTQNTPGQFTQQIQVNPQYKDKTSFTGNFQISQIRHYGNFRQNDAASWNTTVDALVMSN